MSSPSDAVPSLVEIQSQYTEDFSDSAIAAAIGGVDGGASAIVPPADVQTSLVNLFTQGQRTWYYSAVSLSHRFPRSTGKLLLPIGASDTATAGQIPATQLPARIAAVVCQYGYRFVPWEIAREGVPPALPAIEESDNLQLLFSEVMVAHDNLAADGVTRIYYRAGYYMYAYKTPPVPGLDALTVPQSPAVVNESNPVDPEDFVDGLSPVEESDPDTGTNSV